MTKLVRQRYKYLQKSLQEEMTKILKFLKGFGEEQRRSLAIFTALCLSETLISASALLSLLTYVDIHNILSKVVVFLVFLLRGGGGGGGGGRERGE